MKKIILAFLFGIMALTSAMAQTFTVGTGTGANGASAFPAPYSNYWGSEKHQFLIRASELTALGATAGNITELGFNCLSTNTTPNNLDGYTIKLKQVAIASLTAYQTGLTAVYNQNFSPVTGWNIHKFTSCFAWDGTSNIVVEVCHSTAAGFSSSGATTQWTTALGFNGSWYTNTGTCATTTGGTASTSRPNIKLTILSKKDAQAFSRTPFVSAYKDIANNVSIVIRNNGCSSFSSVQVGYKWSTDPAVTETYTGVIAPGATATHTFAGSFTPTAFGYETFKTWVSGPDAVFPDADISNDTIKSDILVIDDPSTNPTAYTGTDFWMGFMVNNDNGASNPTPPFTQTIYLTTNKGNANVTISAPKAIPGTVWSTTVSVSENNVTSVVVPNTINSVTMGTNTADVVSKTGIHIISNNGVGVTAYGLSRMFATTDGYLAIPTVSLDKEYIVTAPIGSKAPTGHSPAEFLIIATEDNTTATIQLPAGVALAGHAAGTTFTTPVLNAGNTYLGQSGSSGVSTTYDLTGTIITGTKKIALLQGVLCANIPTSCNYCDHVNELAIPAIAWGKKYYIANFAVKNSGDIVRVVSQDPGTTTFSFTGQPTQTLVGKGKFKDFTITSGAEILSDKPVFVMQMCKRGYCDAPTTASDPFILNIIPREQWGNLYAFVAPPLSFTSHYVNIVKRSYSGKVTLDGAYLSNASFTQIGTTGYYLIRQAITEGDHIVSGDSAFTASIYGYNNDDSYGYAASGASIAPITVLPINLMNFKASIQNNKGVLTWITASEINNSHFIVERSADGMNFTAISGKIMGHGTTNTVNYYSFTDDKLLLGINYYRLKQVDFDGKSEYSSIVSLNINKLLSGLEVSPIPTNRELFVQFNSIVTGVSEISVIDVAGRVLKTEEVPINEGFNNIPFDLSDIAKGAYFIQVSNGFGQKMLKKIVKN